MAERVLSTEVSRTEFPWTAVIRFKTPQNLAGASCWKAFIVVFCGFFCHLNKTLLLYEV